MFGRMNTKSPMVVVVVAVLVGFYSAESIFVASHFNQASLITHECPRFSSQLYIAGSVPGTAI